VRECGLGKRTGRKTGTAPRADFHHDRIGPAGLDDARDLAAKARSAMHRLQKLPEVIRGFFGDPDLAYITA